MVRDGIYYALGMVLVAAVLWWLAAPLWALVPLLFAVFFLWFFRDPQRAIPAEPGLIVSPADGKVTDVASVQFNGNPSTRVSVFLSVFDVHVNRSPINGVVRNVVYKPGNFRNAMDSASADDNEQSVITVEGQGMTLVFKQIAGLLARRIVCTPKPGDTLARGQRVGMIKFGSRTDVIFPAAATLSVKVGDRVKGGASILAQYATPQTMTITPARKPTEAVP
jgi:phosphatidylserine decarboxylase